MTKAFFTSYARADNEDDGFIEVFVKALQSRVQKKIGLKSAKDVCFLDLTDIQTAEVWEDRLADAVNTARVLVCFCSPTYLSRSFCAKEFDVFRQRLAEDSEADRRAVVPVIWEDVVLPKALSRYQTAKMPAGYESAGLRKLVALGNTASLLEATERLANDIKAAAQQLPPLAPLEARPAFDDLAPSFDDPGNDGQDVGVLILHSEGMEWRIDKFNPPVWELLDPLLTRERLRYRFLDPKTGNEAGARREFSELLTITERADPTGPHHDAIRESYQAHGRLEVLVEASSDADGPVPDNPAIGFQSGSLNEFTKAIEKAVAHILVARSASRTGDLHRPARANSPNGLPTLQGPA